jgi:hypothetical protein
VFILLTLLASGGCTTAVEAPRASQPVRAQDARATSAPLVKDIPFELNANKVYLPVQVNGAGPFWFILDSGAAFNALDKDRAAAAGLKTYGGSTVHGAGARPVEAASASGVSLRLAGREVGGESVAVLPLNSLLSSSEGRAVDGLFGYEFFSRFVVEVDYARQRVSLYEPGGYSPSGGEVVPLEIDRDHALVSAAITTADGRSLQDKFMVDTGFRTGLTLNAPLVESRGLLASTPRLLAATTGVGLGGETRGTVGRVRGLRLGKLFLADTLADFSRDTQGVLSSPFFAGIIGGDILRRFRVIFDYRGGRLVLEPNEHFHDPQEFDMSGLFVVAEGRDLKTFKVLRVVAGTPASEAGVREGDTVEALDGDDAPSLTLERIRQAFKQGDGARHTLELGRGTQRLKVSLRLRRLI